MSELPMRGHFRYLRFKTFLMTPRTPQCEVFFPLLSSSEHSGVPKDSNSPTFPSVGLHPHTWPKWGCDIELCRPLQQCYQTSLHQHMGTLWVEHTLQPQTTVQPPSARTAATTWCHLCSVSIGIHNLTMSHSQILCIHKYNTTTMLHCCSDRAHVKYRAWIVYTLKTRHMQWCFIKEQMCFSQCNNI
jgi:hypothetical protein